MKRKSSVAKPPRRGVKAKAKRPRRAPASSVAALAEQQGVKPVHDPQSLSGDFWPSDENLDDFLDALRGWRSEGREDL